MIEDTPFRVEIVPIRKSLKEYFSKRRLIIAFGIVCFLLTIYASLR